MSKKSKNRMIGAVPGTVKFTGLDKDTASKISYVAYNQNEYHDRDYDRGKAPKIYEADSSLMQWYDIRGLHDIELIERLGTEYSIHQLSLEDIVDVTQRPKYAEFPEGIFISAKSLLFDKDTLHLTAESISLFFGKQYLISFQENEDDTLSEIFSRIHQGRGRVRLKGSDYLAFAILDFLVDQYYIVMDDLEDKINELETELLSHPEKVQKNRIHQLKILLIEVRKYVMPVREAIHQFSRAENEYIDTRTSKYIKDTYDHILQISDMVESNKDTLSGLQDLYMSEISLKMNQIIQFLTIMTSIFVPITFIVGLYGMNFENMPELRYKYGYYITLLVMGTIVLGMLYFFRRRKWL